MTTKGSMETLRRRYERLVRRLGKVGPILQGTITQRTINREGVRSPGESKTYGPYYQWTWKQDGKTVTVNLTASQAKAYQRAIENNQRLQKLIQEMRNLSTLICEASTKGVRKRKIRRNNYRA
jgi:hypothetical protein